MKSRLRILHLEHDSRDVELVHAILQDGGIECESAVVENPIDFVQSIEKREFDIILADYSFPSFDGISALKLAQEKCPEVPFVFISGPPGEDYAIETLKSGETDYVLKRLSRLTPSVLRALREAQKRAELNKAEQALRESEDKYRSFVEVATEWIWSIDREGFMTYNNEAVESILGYLPEELLGKSCLQYLHEEDRLEIEKVLPEWLKQRRGWAGLVLRWKHKDGSYRWLESSAVPVLGRNGDVVGYRGTDRDITGRKQSEIQLQDAESKFRTLVEKVPAIVYMAEFGPSGRWLYVSPQVESLLGFSPEEVLENPGLWFKQLHSEDRQRVSDLELRSQRSGEPIVLEYRMYSRDGRLVWFRDEGVIVPESGDRAAYIQGVMLDITDLKMAEEVKAKLEQQLRQAQKIEAIGQLAGGVAHDFNNLLMAISGYCELLLMKIAVADPARNDVVEISKAAEQGASLTRQLLAFGRKQILQPKILDINHILSNMDGILRRLVREDIEFCTVPAATLGLVKADPGQVERVIMNLVVNARDAMPEGGKLTIETGNIVLDAEYSRHHVSVVPGPYVVLAVSDSGSGMNEETRLRIFEPFFTTKEEGKGTGLGLSTVYGIVKQSGGYIWVYSEPGKGTTFKIYFPRVDDEPTSVQEQRAVASHGTETILLVDDNDSVRTAVAYLLEVRGYTVLQAPNGESALELAQEYCGSIDLMITDMVMPHMSGLQLANQLEATRPKMKVLYMSGYTEEAVNRHGILHPGLNFLQKPTSMDVLLQKIREVLRDAYYNSENEG